MSFNLNDVSRVFTMIMTVCMCIIREVWNVKTEVYLDVLLLLHQDRERLQKIGKEVSLFLQWLGWTFNEDKSHLEPSRIFTYLCWEWNSHDLMVNKRKYEEKKLFFFCQKHANKHTRCGASQYTL
jgi:hypothetical protein